jgi:Tfp pilus assembly protein FimT
MWVIEMIFGIVILAVIILLVAPILSAAFERYTHRINEIQDNWRKDQKR